MPEPAPITQEEKQPPPPEVMVATLRKYQALCAQWAKDDTDLLAYLENNYGRPPLDAPQRKARIGGWEQEGAGLEQTIAILSVLEHPGFNSMRQLHYGNGVDEWTVFWQPQQQGQILFEVGATPLEALLKAHAALKPQEGATSGKEDAGEAP